MDDIFTRDPWLEIWLLASQVSFEGVMPEQALRLPCRDVSGLLLERLVLYLKRSCFSCRDCCSSSWGCT